MEIKDITIEQTIAKNADYLVLQDPATGISYKITKANLLAGLSSSSGGSSSTEIVSTGLVLHLDAANRASYSGSGLIWTDLIGHNNATIINSVTWNSGGYFVFAGGYINLYQSGSSYLSDFNLGTGDFSVEIWVRLLASGIQPIFGINLYSNGLFIRAGSSYQDDVYINGTFYPWLTGHYSTNQWMQLVLSRISGVCTFYINNVAIGNASNSANLTSNSLATLGISNHASTEHINGNISIFRMYKGHGLTQSEVTQNFNINKSRYGL